MLVKQAIVRMMQGKQTAALCCWREQAVESKRVELMMAGAIKQMVHRQLLVAWEQWQQAVAEMKQQSMLLNQGAGLSLTRQLSKGWQKWQQASIGSRATLWFASQARAFGSLSASFAVWHSAHVLGYTSSMLSIELIYFWTGCIVKLSTSWPCPITAHKRSAIKLHNQS